jgi:hypothetical protein
MRALLASFLSIALYLASLACVTGFQSSCLNWWIHCSGAYRRRSGFVRSETLGVECIEDMEKSGDGMIKMRSTCLRTSLARFATAARSCIKCDRACTNTRWTKRFVRLTLGANLSLLILRYLQQLFKVDCYGALNHMFGSLISPRSIHTTILACARRN